MKFPSEAEAASSVNESHVIVECENSSAASVKPKKLTFATLKSWITGFFPTALKNPNALTFTGAATGSYDGSAAKTVEIPSKPTIFVGANPPTSGFKDGDIFIEEL
jgi:hypothetical protein